MRIRASFWAVVTALVLAPAVASAVASNITVTSAGKPTAGCKIKIVDNATGAAVTTATTDESGRAEVDLPAGATYIAKTEDGAYSSASFEAGDEGITMSVPASYGVAEPGGAISFFTDFFVGVSYIDMDSEVSGNLRTEEREHFEYRDGPIPDSPLISGERVSLRNHPFSFDSSDDVGGVFGSASFGLMGPPCSYGGFRPMFYGGIPFNSLSDTTLQAVAPGVGSPIRVDVERWFWFLGAGASREIGRGFAGELALRYQNEELDYDFLVDTKGSKSFRTHYLGPQFQITKSLLRRGRLELGALVGAWVMWPVSGGTHSFRVNTSHGGFANFKNEPGLNWNVGGGIRILFDLPGM